MSVGSGLGTERKQFHLFLLQVSKDIVIVETKSIIIVSIDLALITLFQNHPVIIGLLADDLNQGFAGLFFLFFFIKQIGNEVQIVEGFSTSLLLYMHLQDVFIMIVDGLNGFLRLFKFLLKRKREEIGFEIKFK